MPATQRITNARLDSHRNTTHHIQRPSERYFQTVLTALDTGVVVLNHQGRAEWANPAALRGLGLRAEDLVDGLTNLRLCDTDGQPISIDHRWIVAALRAGRFVSGRVVGVNRPDGRRVWLSVSCSLLDPNDPDRSALLVSLTNVTALHATNQRLVHEATHDALTGLPNRAHAHARITEALTFGGPDGLSAVLFIDLDNLKSVNDSLGHEAGDEMIRVAAQRLRHALRPNDVIARLGGDEFVALLVGSISQTGLDHLSERLHATLGQPARIADSTVNICASIGIATVSEDDPRDVGEILHDADLAMYQAKAAGRGGSHYFTEELRDRIAR